MIDLPDDLIPLAESLTELPERARPTLVTVRAWHTRGLNGKKLEVFRVGRSMFIRPGELRRFVVAAAVAASSGEVS